MAQPIFKRKSLGSRFGTFLKNHGASMFIYGTALFAGPLMTVSLSLLLGPVGIGAGIAIMGGLALFAANTFRAESARRHYDWIKKGNSEDTLQNFVVVKNSESNDVSFSAAKSQEQLNVRYNYFQEVNKLNKLLSNAATDIEKESIQIALKNLNSDVFDLETKYRITGDSISKFKDAELSAKSLNTIIVGYADRIQAEINSTRNPASTTAQICQPLGGQDALKASQSNILANNATQRLDKSSSTHLIMNDLVKTFGEAQNKSHHEARNQFANRMIKLTTIQTTIDPSQYNDLRSKLTEAITSYEKENLAFKNGNDNWQNLIKTTIALQEINQKVDTAISVKKSENLSQTENNTIKVENNPGYRK